MAAHSKEYAREWYAKNKERLKLLPHRKEAQKISAKKYYDKNKDKLKAKSRAWESNNKERANQRKRQYYLENRDKISQQKKKIRQTPEYKAYIKEYRLKNKDRINSQERVASKRYARKAIDEITEVYVITLLTNKEAGCFKTFQEARQYPELIKFYQSQLKFKRLCQQKSKTSAN